MQTKTLDALLEIANKEIKRLDFTESLNLIKKIWGKNEKN